MKHLIRGMILLAGLLIFSDAFAGVTLGVVTYAPPAHAVPALSNVMLVLLGTLFSVIAFRVLRSRSGGQFLASLVALTIAGLTLIPGGKLIGEAYAIIVYEMTNPSGGTVNVGTSDADIPINNNTGVLQQIQGVTATGVGCTVGTPSASPVCTQGATVQSGQSCNVRFNCNLR